MRKKVTYPAWVEKHRKPGTNIVRQKDRFYLYEVTSKWDKKLGRAKKITKKYLGKITQEGLIPPKIKHTKIEEQIVVKQTAESVVHNNFGADILEKLKEYFSETGEYIYTIALIRAINSCAFNKVSTIYQNSFLSNEINNLSLSPSKISRLLSSLGGKRDLIKKFR